MTERGSSDFEGSEIVDESGDLDRSLESTEPLKAFTPPPKTFVECEVAYERIKYEMQKTYN